MQRLFALRDAGRHGNGDVQQNARITLSLLGYHHADPSPLYTQRLNQLMSLGFGRGHADWAIRSLALARHTSAPAPAPAPASASALPAASGAGAGAGAGSSTLPAASAPSASGSASGSASASSAPPASAPGHSAASASAKASADAKEVNAFLSVAHDPQVQAIPMDVASLEKLTNWLIDHPRMGCLCLCLCLCCPRASL